MATIKELAKELGLSTATVSMALRNSPLISEATSARVRALAEERHYVPNNFGRGLQSNRSRLIGALIGSATESFWSELIEAAGYAAAQNGYGFLTGWTRGGGSDMQSQIRLLLEKNVDGFILMVPYGGVETELPWLIDRHKPFVFCSYLCPAQYSCVRNDDFSGGCKAVEHLAANGHREILAGAKVPERLRGFQAGAEKSHAVLHLYQEIDEIPALMRQYPGTTAVAAASDHDAIGIRHALQANGFSVPQDVSLIGYDDFWFTRLPEFNFTTMAQKKSEMGRMAIAQLLAQIEEPEQIRQQLLAPELIQRASVRSL